MIYNHIAHEAYSVRQTLTPSKFTTTVKGLRNPRGTLPSSAASATKVLVDIHSDNPVLTIQGIAPACSELPDQRFSIPKYLLIGNPKHGYIESFALRVFLPVSLTLFFCAMNRPVNLDCQSCLWKEKVDNPSS